MPYLTKLSLVKDQPKHHSDPILARRSKLIERLTEQKDMAQAMINGESFIKYHDVWATDPATGQKVKKQLPRKIRQWYWSDGDQYYLQVLYGSRKLALKANMTTILIVSVDSLVPTIELIVQAVEAGELDKQLGDAYTK